MHIQHDSKRMARVLREKMKVREVSLTHSECLEIVAAQLGARDWNRLAAAGEKVSPQELAIPDGWFVNGQRGDLYVVGVDPTTTRHGDPVAMISRPASEANEKSRDTTFATLMQVFSAENYRAARIELEGWLKAENVRGSGTMWMRVENSNGRILAFDNMEQRESDGALTDASDWVLRRIVLAVPAEAAKIYFGFYLAGDGKIWCSGLDIKVVPGGTEVTSLLGVRSEPENLKWGAVKNARGSLGMRPFNGIYKTRLAGGEASGRP